MRQKEFRGTKENPFHISCGGIVYRRADEGVEILLLFRKKSESWSQNSWHLPKGTIKEGESRKDVVMREVFEETGCIVSVGDFVGTLESHYMIEEIRITKETHYFLCKYVEKKKEHVQEHDDCMWVSISEAIKRVGNYRKDEKEDEILRKAELLLDQEKGLESEEPAHA